MAGCVVSQTGEKVSKLISKCTWHQENNVMVTLSQAECMKQPLNAPHGIFYCHALT